jgi:hypothetical protein
VCCIKDGAGIAAQGLKKITRRMQALGMYRETTNMNTVSPHSSKQSGDRHKHVRSSRPPQATSALTSTVGRAILSMEARSVVRAKGPATRLSTWPFQWQRATLNSFITPEKNCCHEEEPPTSAAARFPRSARKCRAATQGAQVPPKRRGSS